MTNDTTDLARIRQSCQLIIDGRPAGLTRGATPAEVVGLCDEVERLRAENAALRQQVAEAEQTEPALYGTCVEVAKALGLEVWGLEELAPAVRRRGEENARLRENGRAGLRMLGEPDDAPDPVFALSVMALAHQVQLSGERDRLRAALTDLLAVAGGGPDFLAKCDRARAGLESQP